MKANCHLQCYWVYEGEEVIKKWVAFTDRLTDWLTLTGWLEITLRSTEQQQRCEGQSVFHLYTSRLLRGRLRKIARVSEREGESAWQLVLAVVCLPSFLSYCLGVGVRTPALTKNTATFISFLLDSVQSLAVSAYWALPTATDCH